MDGLAGPCLLGSAGVLMARSTGAYVPALGGASIFTRDSNAAAARVSPTRASPAARSYWGDCPSPRVIKHGMAARGSSPVSVVYEAGPTGFGLYRELCRRGYECAVVTPSLIPRRPGERVKNDRRDCLRLSELSRAGELKPIWVPDEAHEAMRNLWRAREDAVGMRLKARQQLKAFLLRHARRYPGKTSWTKTHHAWIAQQNFEHDGDRIALAEYQLAVQSAEHRVQRLTIALTEAGASSPWLTRCAPCVASTHG
jgi:transposase